MTRYRASFEIDGTGNWSITLPADNDEHDVLALGPVIEGIKAFIAPTVDVNEPIGLVPIEVLHANDPPDLIA